jgi:hypothetical protein
MTDAFNPVNELRRNGLVGSNVPTGTEQILGTLTQPQVDVLVQVKQRVDAEHRGATPSTASDAALAQAMTKAMGWDRPSAALVDAEVEGMSVSATEASCACLCTGGGGGGGGGSAD